MDTLNLYHDNMVYYNIYCDGILKSRKLVLLLVGVYQQNHLISEYVSQFTFNVKIAKGSEAGVVSVGFNF